MEKAVGHRIFLLSPAYAGGERARMILREQAQFPLARRLRGKSGAPIADVFTFLSGLYFRGKIAYATAFARPLGLGLVGETVAYADGESWKLLCRGVTHS